jgi:hypothetical protein
MRRPFEKRCRFAVTLARDEGNAMQTTNGLRGYAATAALCALAIWPAAAHHGGDVEWQDAALGPLEGTATKFAFQFPHVFLEMTAEEGGSTATWSITTRWTPTILREHGWSRESIKPGDKISVTYLPHVDKPLVGQMQTIEVNGRALPLSF